MAILRRLWLLLAGERDQPDIAVTRDSSGVCFRLPSRGNDREVWTPWLIGALLLGPLLLGTIINAAANMPPANHNLAGTIGCVLVILGAMAGLAWKWRVTWRYEVRLSDTHLDVDYFAPHRSFHVATVELSKIRQFTILSYAYLPELQAECEDDSLWPLVRDPERDCLLNLTNRINDELGQKSGRIPVKFESPGEINFERSEPPLNSKIVLTRTETGVTLDFPMPEDRRASLRRSAWKLFEAGVLLLMVAVIGFAILTIYQWPDPLPLLIVPFVIGLICLMVSASHASTAWTGTGGDSDLRQLGVAGNLLIRTTRDHNKAVWFGNEIARIEVERDSNEDGPDWLSLKLYTHAHHATTLYGPFGDDSRTDYRRKATLEWIATVLRHALDRNEPEAPLGPPPPEIEESIALAIQDHAAHPAESHITR